MDFYFEKEEYSFIEDIEIIEDIIKNKNNYDIKRINEIILFLIVVEEKIFEKNFENILYLLKNVEELILYNIILKLISSKLNIIYFDRIYEIFKDNDNIDWEHVFLYKYNYSNNDLQTFIKYENILIKYNCIDLPEIINEEWFTKELFDKYIEHSINYKLKYKKIEKKGWTDKDTLIKCYKKINFRYIPSIIYEDLELLNLYSQDNDIDWIRVFKDYKYNEQTIYNYINSRYLSNYNNNTIIINALLQRKNITKDMLRLIPKIKNKNKVIVDLDMFNLITIQFGFSIFFEIFTFEDINLLFYYHIINIIPFSIMIKLYKSGYIEHICMYGIPMPKFSWKIKNKKFNLWNMEKKIEYFIDECQYFNDEYLINVF